ncbi:MAG: 30S ribosomal protein S2 [Phycisphaerales bacterium]|nr:MAG: 30S ribosomal protein S2 [Phycisphaerales bacterium]
MSSLVKDLIEAGIHFGQRRSSWNPKMSPYIFGVRNKIHIIDIRQTIKGLLLAKKFVERTVAEGKDICLVGTKRQARAAIEKYAADVKMPYVTERWLGGTLTNFRTIRERLKRLEELERLVESGEIETYSKKMTSQLLREKRKITRNLQGIRDMNKLPGALVVIDVTREVNALREARGLGIPTVCLVDSDGDPDLVDIPIPGNDDSMRSIEVIIREICEAITRGKSGRVAAAEGEEAEAPVQPQPRRRSSRSQYRAREETPLPADDGAPPAVETPTSATAPPPAAEPAPEGKAETATPSAAE